MTRRPGFGRMRQGWKWLVLLEKIPNGLEEANTSRKNRAREGEKSPRLESQGRRKEGKEGETKLVCGERGGT